MTSLLRPTVFALLALLAAWPARAGDAVPDATLLRLFLSDGTALVSYGEFARIDDRVVFSMPVGGTPDQPRLHVVSIPAGTIDWPRTERYCASARFQRYAATRGEADFLELTTRVARVLNEIALTTEPARALEAAMRARGTMAEWPAAHYGYRQRDVSEIVSLLDEAIVNLRANAGVGAFDLALSANVRDVELEPLLGMPEPRESLDGILRVARMSSRSADRVSLLQHALLLLDESATAIPRAEASPIRSAIRSEIRVEEGIDANYARVVRRLLSAAERAAASAQVRDVEAVLARIPVEDARLGQRRPDVMEALQASLTLHLDTARHLRLLRDQWMVRRALYREYQHMVGSQLLQLVKSQPVLESIRRLDGPAPDALTRVNGRLAGGAEQLQRVLPPLDLRAVHEMLVGAWRFAEQAIQARRAAVSSASVGTAWEASSAAAASLMLLANAQRELRSLAEPPRIR